MPDGARWTRVEGIVQLIPTMESLDADKKTAKAETKAVETAPENPANCRPPIRFCAMA